MTYHDLCTVGGCILKMFVRLVQNQVVLLESVPLYWLESNVTGSTRHEYFECSHTMHFERDSYFEEERLSNVVPLWPNLVCKRLQGLGWERFS